MSQFMYWPKSSAKRINASFERIECTFHQEELMSLLTNQTLANEKGYVTFVVTERKTPSKFGDTHTLAIHDPMSVDAQLQRTLSAMTAEDKEKLLKKAQASVNS